MPSLRKAFNLSLTFDVHYNASEKIFLKKDVFYANTLEE